MSDDSVLTPITDEQLVQLTAQIHGCRELLRLLNSGAGGVAQVKRVTRQRLTDMETQLELAKRMQRSQRGLQ